MDTKLQAYYDGHASWNPEYFDWKISRYMANRAIMRSFEWIDWSGKRVLDIGCGQGFYSIPLAWRCAEIMGFDLSEANVEIAVRHAARLKVNNSRFLHADIFDFTPDEPFDIAYSITVLMHIRDLLGALRRIYGFLKPGGLFLISDLNRWYHTRLFQIHRPVDNFLRTFTHRELHRNLEAAGFKVLRESGRLYSLAGRRQPEWMVCLALENWAESWPLKFIGEHVAILAKKV